MIDRLIKDFSASLRMKGITPEGALRDALAKFLETHVFIERTTLEALIEDNRALIEDNRALIDELKREREVASTALRGAIRAAILGGAVVVPDVRIPDITDPR